MSIFLSSHATTIYIKIISSKQREDYAHQQNQQTRERYDSPLTQEHPALEVGTNVIIHNIRNSGRARWDKTRMVAEKLAFRQYCVKIAGSGHIILHNCKFIKDIPLSTNHSIIPSPLHIIIQKYKIILTYNQSTHQMK